MQDSWYNDSGQAQLERRQAAELAYQNRRRDEVKETIERCFAGKLIPFALQSRIIDEISEACTTRYDVVEIARSADKIRQIAETIKNKCKIDYMRDITYDLVCVALDNGLHRFEFSDAHRRAFLTSEFHIDIATHMDNPKLKELLEKENINHKLTETEEEIKMQNKREEIEAVVGQVLEGKEDQVQPGFKEAVTDTVEKFDGALKSLAESEAADKEMEQAMAHAKELASINSTGITITDSNKPDPEERKNAVVVAHGGSPRIDPAMLRQLQELNVEVVTPEGVDLSTQPDRTNIVQITPEDLKNKSAAELANEQFHNLFDGLTPEKIDEMSDEEVSAILPPAVVANAEKFVATTGEKTPEEFRRDFLKYMVAQTNVDKIIEEEKKVLETMMAQFQQELAGLVKNLDTQEELIKVEKELETVTDPEHKRQLIELRTILHGSLYLNTLTDRFENLGGKAAVAKRVKKDFKKEQKNFYRYIKNDKANMFLDPSYLVTDLKKIIPNRFHGQIEGILYLLYREVTKNKKITMAVASFVNYFLVNVKKCVENNENEDRNVAEFKQSLINLATLLR